MMNQHKCPWPLCAARVDADLWGCKRHWYLLPPALRRALWEAYVPGQSMATASAAYLAAASAIDTWVRLYFQTVAPSIDPPKIGRARKSTQGTLPI